MDDDSSPFRLSDADAALIAEIGVSEFFSLMFHRAVLEAEKANPAHFVMCESRYLH